tara:strand:+ start:312 stop:428 length:117 start_codon:yes stop_codon:yes gene_type:complete
MMKGVKGALGDIKIQQYNNNTWYLLSLSAIDQKSRNRF